MEEPPSGGFFIGGGLCKGSKFAPRISFYPIPQDFTKRVEVDCSKAMSSINNTFIYGGLDGGMLALWLIDST